MKSTKKLDWPAKKGKGGNNEDLGIIIKIDMTNPPEFKVGDTIYWYCDEDGRVHHAEVQYVNYAKVGNYYIEVNYEVEEERNGIKKTFFIDDYDAMGSEL